MDLRRGEQCATRSPVTAQVAVNNANNADQSFPYFRLYVRQKSTAKKLELACKRFSMAWTKNAPTKVVHDGTVIPNSLCLDSPSQHLPFHNQVLPCIHFSAAYWGQHLIHHARPQRSISAQLFPPTKARLEALEAPPSKARVYFGENKPAVHEPQPTSVTSLRCLSFEPVTSCLAPAIDGADGTGPLPAILSRGCR